MQTKVRCRSSVGSQLDHEDSTATVNSSSIMGRLTQRQWKTLVVLYAANIFVFVAIGILPPFFPALAMQKGASPALFGLVFGSFRLTMGLISPVYGHYMETLGPKLLLCSGVLATSGCCLLMGVVEYVQGTVDFISISSAIQIVSALGIAAVTNVNLVVINKEFPDNSASVFATVETASGIGNFIGPLLGGVLIEAGGYKLPFLVVGCILVMVAVLGVYVLPEPKTSDRFGSTSGTECETCGLKAWQLFQNFAFSMYLYIVIATCFAYGFFLVTLEYHLRPMHLTPIQISLVFGLNSAIYCVSSTGHGWLCDKLLRPATVACWGACITVVGFFLLGPAPFTHLHMNIMLVAIGTVLFSAGNGAQVVATFAGTYREALASGAPDNVATYGIVGGIWNFFFCMSSFLGFSVGGVLLSTIGYQWAAMVVVSVEAIGIIGAAGYLCAQNTKSTFYISI